MILGWNLRWSEGIINILYKVSKVGLDIKQTTRRLKQREPRQQEGTENANWPQFKSLPTV